MYRLTILWLVLTVTGFCAGYAFGRCRRRQGGTDAR